MSAYDEPVCEQCGKTEEDCDWEGDGPALSTYAVNGKLWCPDCISDDCNEEESESESEEENCMVVDWEAKGLGLSGTTKVESFVDDVNQQIRDDQKQREREIEELKEWRLSDAMIEQTSAETVEEFEQDVRDNWEENKQLQEQVKKLTQQNTELKAELEDATSRESSMFQTLNKKRKEESEWALKKIAQLQEQVKKLTQQVGVLQRMNKRIRKALDEADAEQTKA